MGAARRKGGKEPDFDLGGFALTDAEVAALGEVAGRRLPSRGKGWPFLRGPVPLAWLDRAARLTGKALAVGLALWFKHGLTGSRTVSLCQEHVGFGVNEQAARRAVKALEAAGLVSAVRRPGRGLEVTILDLHETEPDPARETPPQGAG